MAVASSREEAGSTPRVLPVLRSVLLFAANDQTAILYDLYVEFVRRIIA